MGEVRGQQSLVFELISISMQILMGWKEKQGFDTKERLSTGKVPVSEDRHWHSARFLQRAVVLVTEDCRCGVHAERSVCH